MHPPIHYAESASAQKSEQQASSLGTTDRRPPAADKDTAANLSGAAPNFIKIPFLPPGLPSPNQAITSALAQPALLLQRKLAIGGVDDPLEREADRIADCVMRMGAPASIQTAPETSLKLRRKCSCGSSASGKRDTCKKEMEGTLQRSASSRPAAEYAPPIVHDVLRSSGQPLDGATRAFFEPRLGRDLSDVRTHVGPQASKSARAVNALAYTANNDIVFGEGQFSPQTARGRHLLAHELTHVFQQGTHPADSLVRRQLSAPPTKFVTSAPEDISFPAEDEASLDKKIENRKKQDSPDGKGKYIGNVTFKGLPELSKANTKEKKEEYSRIRRAAKKALTEAIITDITKKGGIEMRVRIPLEDTLAVSVDINYAMIVLRFDGQRNVEVEYVGSNLQKARSEVSAGAVLGSLEKTYDITFVSDGITAKLPDAKKAKEFKGKQWSNVDAMLLDQALPLLGSNEKGILKNCKFRRLAVAVADGAAGFFSTGDRSVNLTDSALPTDKTLWFGEGGKFYSRAVHTVLHEVGHALSYGKVPTDSSKGKQTTMELFKNAVKAQSAKLKKKTADAKFLPPGIITPTEYAKTSWHEFYADTYSLYITNPSFLQTPDFQYLYDFFKSEFP